MRRRDETNKKGVMMLEIEDRTMAEVKRVKDKADSVWLMVSQMGVYLPMSVVHELGQINEALTRIRQYAFDERVKEIIGR